MLTIPTEMFLNILDYLKKDYETPQGAMTILNLAKSCRGFWHIIESWASTQARQDLQTLSSLCDESTSSLPSALSVLCRRLGNICIFCSNRARSSAREVFTNLPICRACEPRKVPKISNINLERLFTFSGPEDLLKNLESRENLDHHLYRWTDIEPMVVNGDLKRKHNIRKSRKNLVLPYNPEEYAEFCFRQLGNTEKDWFEMHRYLREIFLDEILQTWNKGPFDIYSPILIELSSFNEFRYRFDYSWEPKRTHEEQVTEYASIARHWIQRDMWDQRPWRLSAFPKTPRCSVSNPYAQQYHKDMDQEEYSEHQQICKLRRALIRAYPAILSSPDIWCRCVNESQFDTSISLAISASLSNPRTKRHNFDFELLTSLKCKDVRVTRTARNRDLKPVIYERYFEREDITLRKVVIVSIRQDSAEIKLPGPGARVKYIGKDEMLVGKY